MGKSIIVREKVRMRASVKTKIVSLVLRPREWEKVAAGRMRVVVTKTIPAGEVSDPLRSTIQLRAISGGRGRNHWKLAFDGECLNLPP